MSRKENGDPAAAALAHKRWDKVTKAKRSEHARKMAETRWAEVRRRKQEESGESAAGPPLTVAPTARSGGASAKGKRRGRKE